MNLKSLLGLEKEEPETVESIKAKTAIVNAKIELETAKAKLKDATKNKGILSSLNDLLSNDTKKQKRS